MNKPTSFDNRIWRISDTDDILWAQWDEQFIAFHRPSGKTHLLNAATEKLLTRILINSRSTLEIVGELLAGDGSDFDDGLVTEIEATLFHLNELGLVERV